MNDLALLTNLDTMQKVFAFEEFAKKQPQLELVTKHYFSYGVYAREIYIPVELS